MATLFEYFLKDFSHNLSIEKKWKIRNIKDDSEVEINARVYLDFHANAKYAAFYIPTAPNTTFLEALAMNSLQDILEVPSNAVGISTGFADLPDEIMDSRDLMFAGRVFLYSEREPPADLKARLKKEALSHDVRVVFRSEEYLKQRNAVEKPKAFISHDSRDKAALAEPLAIQLQKFLCPVWYDEFSLKVGDSLRAGIESGLKACPKCIFILTPNFLSNGGWSKREYDSIFTRELVENQQVILPVWSRVSVKDVYQYSPILADRLAVDWSIGVEEVARRLMRSLNTP